MNRVSHLLFAMDTQLALSMSSGQGPASAGCSVAVAGLASWGPDLDQLWPWKRVDKVLPDEALGNGGPMRHRGITHWWFWPLLAGVLAHRADMGDVGWVVWALIWGWTSHLVGDFLFGEEPQGIPLAPWWCHVGVRTVLPSRLAPNSGGIVERILFIPGLLLVTGWWLTGFPGLAQLTTQAAVWAGR
jgi:hypothetical protein